MALADAYRYLPVPVNTQKFQEPPQQKHKALGIELRDQGDRTREKQQSCS
jgi:hypothetical protein